MSALLAFLHHLAAFTLAATLAIEFVLILACAALMARGVGFSS